MKLSASVLSVLCTMSLLTACNSSANKEAELVKAKQKTIDSMKVVIAKQAAIDSMSRVMSKREEETRIENEEKNSQIAANNNASANNVTPAATRKKGWNHTAKGAVVGAGTGAITGAIVNKKRVEGAVIGSLIGAGVGAGTGALVDASKKKKHKSN